MHENFPAGAILTNGLGCDAGRGLAIITQFNLWLDVTVTIIPHTTPGGSYPLYPGEIQNFYTPVNVDPAYLVPYVNPLKPPRSLVIIRVAFKEHVKEMEYLVGPRRANVVITVMKLLEATRRRISVVGASIRKVASRASVLIRRLRKRNR